MKVKYLMLRSLSRPRIPLGVFDVWAVTWYFQHVVFATSKASNQPAHTRSLIGGFAGPLNILGVLSYWTSFGVSKLNSMLHRLVWVYTSQYATLLEITCRGSSSSFAYVINLQRDCARSHFHGRYYACIWDKNHFHTRAVQIWMQAAS